MRKASTLVGLTLFALASAARAQEAAPAATTADPSPSEAIAAPAPEVAAPVGLTSNAPPPAASRHKIQVGLSFLPMALGKYPAGPGSASSSVDAAFAYGAVLTVGYEILPGLTVGVAPQETLNVKAKDGASDAGKQLDLLVRVAYAYPIVDTISVYAEVLPGYSIISVPNSSSKGLVLVYGAGALMDLGDSVFANLGVGYEMGFLKVSATGGAATDAKTSFLRVALGGGVKF